MRTIIHSFSLPMIILIGIVGYCFFKYSEGVDKLSKANSVCSIDYSIGDFMDNKLLGKFDPTLGQWTNQAFKYFGQACFYTITHVNGVFNSKVKWGQTQIYNTNEYSLIRKNQNIVDYDTQVKNVDDHQPQSKRVIEDE